MPVTIKQLKQERSVESLAAQIQKRIKGRSVTLAELSSKFDRGVGQIREALSHLEATGYNVKLAGDKASILNTLPENSRLVVNSRDFFDGTWHKFGVTGDSHLCSRYARLDVLHALYDIYEREGITTVYHTGNIVDGECRFNHHDLIVRAGMGAQAEYTVQEYPQRKGITTYFVTGDDHEGWYLQRDGVNFGQYLQDQAERADRHDLKWIGHVEVDITLKARNGNAWMRVAHPGGGSAYAISYTGQKIVESYQGGEKPHILFLGHYHKFNYDYSREVHIVQTGCTEDQTIFMRKKKIQAHVGGLIVRFHQAHTGEINRFNPEWLPFYDRKFYTVKDKYRQW